MAGYSPPAIPPAPWPQFTPASKQILQLQRDNITVISDGEMYVNGLLSPMLTRIGRFPREQNGVPQLASHSRSIPEVGYLWYLESWASGRKFHAKSTEI